MANGKWSKDWKQIGERRKGEGRSRTQYNTRTVREERSECSLLIPCYVLIGPEPFCFLGWAMHNSQTSISIDWLIDWRTRLRSLIHPSIPPPYLHTYTLLHAFIHTYTYTSTSTSTYTHTHTHTYNIQHKHPHTQHTLNIYKVHSSTRPKSAALYPILEPSHLRISLQICTTKDQQSMDP